LEFLGK